MRGFFHYEGGTQGLCYQGVHHEVHGSSLGLEGRMQWGFSGWPGVRVGEFLWFQRILVGMMLTRVGDVQLIGWICQLGDVQLMSCCLSRMRLSGRIYRDVWSKGDRD